MRFPLFSLPLCYNKNKTIMSKWIISYIEVGSGKVRTTTHSGNKTKEEVIEFFGLNESDIEWYDVVLSEE
jgi:hypothetical protein